MKIGFIIVLCAALLASGCLADLQGEKVPVVYASVTMDEDANGNMTIRGVEAYAGEMPKLSAPQEEFPGNFPAIYVDVVQKMMPRNFQTGKDYKGPGVYNFTIGFQGEINKSDSMLIGVEAVNNKSETVDLRHMNFNWSSKVQNKTFK